MTGQVTVLLQGPVSVLDSTFVDRRSSAKVLPCSGGGQHFSAGRHVKPVSGSRGVEALRINRSLVGKRVKSSIGKRNFPLNEPLNWAQRDTRRKWRAKSNTSLTHSPAEPSTSDESPLTSGDSKEDQPMRNAGFVARFLREFGRFWKRFSPRNILNGVLGFLRGRGRRFVFLWSALACTISLIFLSGTIGGGSPRVVPYSELVNHLQAKSVTTALFEEGSSHLFFNLEPTEDGASVVLNNQDAKVSEELMAISPMIGHEGLVNPTSETDTKVPSSSSELGERDQGVPSSQQKASKPASQKWAYSTRRIRNDEAFLLPLMRDAGVRYSSAPQSVGASLKTIVITAMTLWIPLSPLLWLLHRQMSTNGGGKKKQKVKRLVRFEDVAGVDIAKAELMEIVECMRGVPKFSRLGAKVPKGVLLVGPPGTGKTLLARAVAGEARVPFFAASASEFVEMFVGRGAARIRELFSEARKNTPSIVFIDELDAVGGPRGRSFNDERDQTLNQLLTEMDGFESETGVLVIAATNRPNALDPALCRPGRLSRRVHVTEPDLQGRQQVLAVHMRGVPVAEDPVPLRRVVASMTAGFVGADLANLVNEAALLAARKGRGAVIFEDFREAIDRVKYGVGNRRQNVFKEVEQRVGSWFSGLYPATAYPAAPSGS